MDIFERFFNDNDFYMHDFQHAMCMGAVEESTMQDLVQSLVQTFHQNTLLSLIVLGQ